jgi:hypothetical protein
MPPLTILHGCATIQLTRGFNTLVDVDDYHRFNQRKWMVSGNPPYSYARRKQTLSIGPTVQAIVYLHREILALVLGKIPPKKLCDHKNRDARDNRRENLRAASSFQNRVNARKKLWRGKSSSQYKGVSWHKKTSKWRVTITLGDKQHELGLFDSEIEAARAYNAAALGLFRGFAKVNENI